jgi:hypothetical protein
MRTLFLSIYLSFNVMVLAGQDCSILSKANNILPDRLCSPLGVSWHVEYTGVNNAGTPVRIRFNWDDGNVDTEDAISTGPGIFSFTADHTYVSTGEKCNYRPKATLIVNGTVCSSSTQEQIVTVWDDDDHNGGHLHISPEIYPVCFGNGADVKFQDQTQFNCVPPQEKDVPNLYTRWVQWIYGTDNTMTGTPVTINGTSHTFPYYGPVITLPGPVTGSGVYSDILNVASDKNIGQYFQVTLLNWNYCNPYDDPNIPGPPTDTVNGDHPPVKTTAIILIVPYPDASITPVDTLCVDSEPVKLSAHDEGGIWSGDGVSGDKFYPSDAGPGDHIISYAITDVNNCSDADQTTITVMPERATAIDAPGTVYLDDPPVTLSASPPGGTWTGEGVFNGLFYPDSAGTGLHVISYYSLPDRFGCPGSDTIHVNVILPSLPGAYFEPDTSGCSPLHIIFRNKSDPPGSYIWDFGDNTYSTEKNPDHTYYLPGQYIVKLVASNIAGNSSASQIITVYQSPEALFTVYPTDVFNNTQVVVFTNISHYGSSYTWDFGDGTFSTEESPWHKYDTMGVYRVTLTVRTTDGCVDSLRFDSPIRVDFRNGKLNFPNAFRWNRSGPTGGYWNDDYIDDSVFRPFFKNITGYNLQIFNRWGVLIYESDDLNKGWDGYFRDGNLAGEGVYVYKVTGQYADGTYFVKTGDVTFLH